jgi:hypothetical protein
MVIIVILAPRPQAIFASTATSTMAIRIKAGAISCRGGRALDMLCGGALLYLMYS